MPRRATPHPAALHPIRVVTRRTGISAEVLRVWEKRYAVVTPLRSANGRRLYTDADIERLRLLVEATRTGRSIGQVAALDNAALVARLAEEHRPARTLHGDRVESALPAPAGAADLLDACIAAIAQFDAVALDLLLRRAIVALSADDFLDAIVVPLVEHLRQHARDGALRRPHRHLAHAVLRRVLDHVVATATAPLASRDLVVATLAGHAHELDALVVAAAAAADGWRVTWVGPGVSPDDIVELLQHMGARVLAVSVAASTGKRPMSRELRRLRTLVPVPVELLVVAPAAGAHRAVPGESGATPLVGLAVLRARLRALREATSTRA
jgi:DNA-binding transcriptional MerR regulator/methylmalonyl-CoA mutase cobalamin-binding subunit